MTVVASATRFGAIKSFNQNMSLPLLLLPRRRQGRLGAEGGSKRELGFQCTGPHRVCVAGWGVRACVQASAVGRRRRRDSPWAAEPLGCSQPVASRAGLAPAHAAFLARCLPMVLNRRSKSVEEMPYPTVSSTCRGRQAGRGGQGQGLAISGWQSVAGWLADAKRSATAQAGREHAGEGAPPPPPPKPQQQ